MEPNKKITLAVNAGISFGSKLTSKQLIKLAKYLDDDSEIELTTFQQLYIKVPEKNVEEVIVELEKVGLRIYKVGPYVKSLRTCSFCKGSEEEGMPVAIELNNRIAGQDVPFTLRPAYTGCSNACGEPLVNDIGVIKRKNGFDLYVGGKANGMDAKTAVLLQENLQPEQLYELIDEVLEVYRQHGKRREHFSKFLERFGMDKFTKELGIANH
ncbi:nitrite reductase [Alkalihalobacillus sp. AL-G]|uniref:nitrite reductase n=1 Tax=Alkalihalobacillus sp. AL-G TaxID=2926399 RepID=UPI002729C3DB|nr:nitrite reductase [Alkalihalobacillus sp. AL-G]WLD92028.1 nitrite reductase [Alkalihalobacillus sp. AL-G]